jgi:translation initiation factor IF-3
MGKDILDKIVEDLDLIGKVDSAPKLEGKQMSMMMSPV